MFPVSSCHFCFVLILFHQLKQMLKTSTSIFITCYFILLLYCTAVLYLSASGALNICVINRQNNQSINMYYYR